MSHVTDLSTSPDCPSCPPQDVFYEDRHYHADCFRCSRCQRPLAEQPFSSRGDALVCADCYSRHFSSKCSACGGKVTPGNHGNHRLSLRHQPARPRPPERLMIEAYLGRGGLDTAQRLFPPGLLARFLVCGRRDDAAVSGD